MPQPLLRTRTPDDTRPRLIAIDWGTTSLRGVLINAQGQIADQRALPKGILGIDAGGFEAAWQQHFGDWLALSPDLCLLSGMVGSRQGWREAAYCPCPANFDALSRHLLWLDTGSATPCAIVPGMSYAPHLPVNAVNSVPDVMRGEEIQVIGAQQLMGADSGLFVLPGTHSKWVTVANNTVTQFSTFMTGELYALLAQHSLLAKTTDSSAPFDLVAFTQGLDRAQLPDALSHLLFGVRALSLFDQLDSAQSASYLSGLLIGQEIRSMQPAQGTRIALIGSSALTQRYAAALQHVGCDSIAFHDEATWAGHQAIYHYLTGASS